MNQRPTIREQMDACRPDSDDLHLPEHAADLTELAAGLRESGEVRTQWERSQQEGRVVRSAMHDVSLPAGLEARLLAAVQAAESVALTGVKMAADAEFSVSESPVVLAPAKANRRRFIQVAVGLTTAALVLFGFIALQQFNQTEQPITKDQLAAQVEEWLSVSPKSMAPTTKADLAAFPSGIVLGKVPRSGSYTVAGGKITVYDVVLRNNRATLLVIPTTKVYPVGALPLSNIPGVSGGWQVRAWQTGGVLYVIAVIENPDARLDEFIRQQPIG